MFLVTASLVEDGDIYLEASDRVVLRRGPGETWVSKYGLGQSIAQMPAYIVGGVVAGWTRSVEPTFMKYFITSFTNAAISAGVCVFVYLICMALGYGRGISLYVVALAGFGTLLWPQSKTLFSEPLQTLCLTGGFYMAAAWRQSGGAARAAMAAIFIGLLCATKPIMALTALPVMLYFADGFRVDKKVAGRAASAALFLGIIVLFALSILYYNYLRFGSVFEFGYAGGVDRDGVHGFNTPVLVGLHGLLLSSGKGLIFYAPAAALAVFGFKPMSRRFGPEAHTIAALALITAVACAKWNAWHGDYAWGPRFMGPVIPLLAVMAGALFARESIRRAAVARALAVAALAVSLFVNILGTAVNENEFIIITKRQPVFGLPYVGAGVELRDDLLNAHYIPEYSPIAGHWWILRNMASRREMNDEELSAKMASNHPWRELTPNLPPMNAARAARPDAWWHYIPAFYPESARWARALATALVALAALSAAGLAIVEVQRWRGSPRGEG